MLHRNLAAVDGESGDGRNFNGHDIAINGSRSNDRLPFI